jgi:hypothetical protein
MEAKKVVQCTLGLGLGAFASFCAYWMIDDLRGEAGTPFNLFFLAICLGLIFIATLIVAQQRKVLAVYILATALLGLLTNPATISSLLLAHASIGVLVLVINWRGLK